jgi:hypothetical protein
MTNLEIRAEGNKLLHDTMKQLIAISSGSIVILIAFMEKIFTNPRWKLTIVVAVVCFLLCAIASLVMMRTISLKMGAGYSDSRSAKLQKVEDLAFPAAAATFLIAMAAIVVFLIKNLLS